ncbi:MAG: ABC transporter permease [Armatimonadetes bacterium]|nr:ABC transporter permease [Armatimonadota bacterium]
MRTNFKFLLGEAILALQANKARSLLTVLGIVIGVAAVIIMISLGQGAEKRISAQMQRMGSNLLMVFPGAAGAQVRGAGGTVNTLTLEDARAIARLPGVARTTAEISTRGTASQGSQTWVTSVTGTTPEMPLIANQNLENGRFFDEQDLRGFTNVAVLGKTVVDNLFPAGTDPVGQTVRINKIAFTVIGVLSPTGASAMGRDEDDVIYVPLTTAQVRLLGVSNVQNIRVQAVSESELEHLPEAITALLRERHRLPANAENDFTVRNLAAVLEAAQTAAGVMTTLLAGVAAVSLLVGGIGIMNIMLVSVTERTREIGIRMAVGATERAILLQFLTEAVVLSLSGGIIGIAIGVATSLLITVFAGWSTSVSFGAILLSVLFATGVGVFFGFYPARRAASLNPVEALRYE